MLVDSHCHLNYEGLIDRQPEVLAAARARGVSAMLNICPNLRAAPRIRHSVDARTSMLPSDNTARFVLSSAI